MTDNPMKITFEKLRYLADSVLTKEEKNCPSPSLFFKEASDLERETTNIRREKMKIENVKEFITNVRERNFDPLVWVGELPNDISPEDKEIKMFKGLINYQANQFDDLMRVLLTIAENMDQVCEDRENDR